MSAIDAAPAAMASLLVTMSSLVSGTLGDLLLGTRVRILASINGTVSAVDTCDFATSIFFSRLSTKRSTLRASAISASIGFVLLELWANVSHKGKSMINHHGTGAP